MSAPEITYLGNLRDIFAGTRAGKGIAMAQEPTVGRIVHYTPLETNDPEVPQGFNAAIITRVNLDGSVGLQVFYPGSLQVPFGRVWETSSPAGSEEARGRWCWPALK